MGGEGGASDNIPFKIDINLARKVLKTVLESSQKIMGGIVYTQNAFYLAKNAVRNQTFYQMLCNVHILTLFIL